MKFVAFAASLALVQQPCVANSISTTTHLRSLDQQRSLSSGWALCGPEGGKQEWMWVLRQVCDANGIVQCRPGWRSTDDDPFCGYEVPECMEGDPCNVGLVGGAQCVEKDPDNGLYECVCDFGLNGSNDLGFGPTNCGPTCVANPGLCDTANGGFCTVDNSDNFSCACPSDTVDVNGDGSFCRGSGNSVSPEDGTPDTACPDEGCPAGQFCGKKPAGGDVCVIIDLNPNDDEEGVDDPDEAFCKKIENVEECCTDELKAKCDSNNYCGIHPDRGPVCFCNPGWWHVHPGGFCREETSNCANCAPTNSQCIKNVCSCSSGYIGNGNTCIDQNECDLKLDNCDANQGCVNTDGGFKCIDILVDLDPTPIPTTSRSPSRSPVSNPGPTFVTAPLVVTLTLDDQAATENSIAIFNTFNNIEVLFESSGLVAGPTELTSKDSIKSNGCYTLVVYDTGSGGSEGLFNNAATPQVQVRIGGRLLLDEELAPQNVHESFPFKSYRFGTGCVCTGGKTAYDIKLFDPVFETERLLVFDELLDFNSIQDLFLFFFDDPLIFLNDPSIFDDPDLFDGLGILRNSLDVLYEAIPPGTLIDTRVCTSSCRAINVYGTPSYFKVTKANGNSIDVDNNDFKLVEGTINDPLSCFGSITDVLIGNNCCPTGSKLLHQSFFSPITPSTPDNDIPMVTRELNAVLTNFLLDIPGYSAGTDITSNIPESYPEQMSQCVEAVACLEYEIPTIDGLSYLINLDNDVRSGTSTTTDSSVFIKERFGTMCDGGSLMISLMIGTTTGTSVIVTDVNNGEVALYLLPTDTSGAPNGSIEWTLSPSSKGCYSVTIVNPDGNADGSITYNIKFEGASILQTNSPFPFPAESDITAMYDTVRFGDGCQCDPSIDDGHAQIPVNMQLLVLGNSDPSAQISILSYTFLLPFPLFSTFLYAANAFVYDVGVCIHSNEDNELDISQLSGSGTQHFLSLDVDSMKVQRTDNPPSLVQLIVCDPATHDEVELTTSDDTILFSMVEILSTSLSTSSISSFISFATVSMFNPKACIPRDACIVFTLENADAVLASGVSFTFQNKDASIKVGDGLFPVDPFFSGSCPSIMVTVEGASTSTSVYAYDARTAISQSASGLLLNEAITALSSNTFTTSYNPLACYTVAIVDTAGNLDDATVSVSILQDSNETPSTPQKAFDDASGKFYQYYEVGLCGCGADQNKEIKILWYTPPDASADVTSIAIRQTGADDRLKDEFVMDSFLYNYISCVTPEEQLSQCFDVQVVNMPAALQKAVLPLNFYHVYFGDGLLYTGVYARNDGGSFTQGCCLGQTKDIAVFSYHIGRDPNHPIGLTRKVKLVENSGTAVVENDITSLGGASFVQHYCYDVIGDTACAQIELDKSVTRPLNFGEDGFVRVAYVSEIGKASVTVAGDATGTDLTITPIKFGSATCIGTL